MRKLLLSLTILLTVYGCVSKKEKLSQDDGIISNQYIVFMTETFAEPLIKSIDTTMLVIDTNVTKSLDQKRTKLKDSVQRYFERNGIKIDKNEIFVDVAVGAVLHITPDMIAKDMLAKLSSDTIRISSVMQDVKIDINTEISIRPIQQTDPGASSDPLKRWLSDPIAQIRPIQQTGGEQANYDIILDAHGTGLITQAISTAGGPVTWTSSNHRKIWFLDTGIDSFNTHLNVDFSHGITYVGTSTDDDNGHGTFCAGIAAGKPVGSENPGLPLIHYGLSEGAPVVPVKVLDKNGQGEMSNVILGLDSVAHPGVGNRDDIVNLSLGEYDIGNSYDIRSNKCSAQGIDVVIQNLANRLIYVTMAAGNNAGNAKSNLPGCVTGRADRIFTVSSVNRDLTCAEYANFNVTVPPTQPVEFVTIGTRVFSLWDNNQFRMASGTSVSSALVAGIIHVMNSKPAFDPHKLIACEGTSTGAKYKLAKH